MSSKNSQATFWIVTLFAAGLTGYLAWGWMGAGKPESEGASVVTADGDDVLPDPYRTTVVGSRSVHPVELKPDVAPIPSYEKDAFLRRMYVFETEAPDEPMPRLAHGMRLLLNPSSDLERIRKGLSILTSHDIRAYGGFAKLRQALLDPDADPDFRRRELLRFLEITEHRVRLLRSVLEDDRRIDMFRRGEFAEGSDITFPEPLDFDLGPSPFDLPAGVPDAPNPTDP